MKTIWVAIILLIVVIAGSAALYIYTSIFAVTCRRAEPFALSRWSGKSGPRPGKKPGS